MYKRINELLGLELNNNNEISWSRISREIILTEDFIREFKDYVDWGYISSYQLLSWNFILEFEDKVNWISISTFQPFIDPNHEKILKSYLKYNELFKCYSKNKTWGIGYVSSLEYSIYQISLEYTKNKKDIGIYFSLNSKIKKSGIRFDKTYIKLKFYWKDLRKLNMINKFEVIREFRYV